MEGELIYVSLITSIFMLMGIFLLSQNNLKNFFKKEDYKTNRDLLRAKNKLEIQKMRRDLGLGKGKNSEPAPQPESQLGILKSLSPFIRNMDGEQIADLIERFTGGEEAAPEEMGALGGLYDFYQDNKELVDGILDGIKSKTTAGQQSAAGSAQNY